MNDSQSPQRRAVVTGGGRGIGRAIAERLAADGFHVTATDVDVSPLAGSALDAVELDVCDRVAVAAFFAAGAPVDVLVNNAGIGAELLPFADLTPEAVARVLRVNLHGPFVMAQEAARRMPWGGAIINIASRGWLGGAGAAHYVASKAGVVGLTRAMAIELRWQGITVNAVGPGMVATQMIESFTPEMRAALDALEPSGGAADPAEIAGVVAFLASPDARNMTGQMLTADFGKSSGVAMY